MKRTSRIFILITPLFLQIFFSESSAQISILSTPSLNKTSGGIPTTRIPSNSISHIAVRGSEVWLGTGKGLAKTSDGGRTFSSFRYVPEFASPGIFSIDVRGDTVWASTGYSEEIDNNSVQTGSGYTYSFDNGATWRAAQQPLDPANDSLERYGVNTVRFIPITVREQNVTFDLALTDSVVWVASWSSGLRKRAYNDTTWHRTVLPSSSRGSIAPTDTLVNYLIDPRLDNAFLIFSVYPEDNRIIWAGSAGGIHRSPDGGLSWTTLTADNEPQPILGNWVIAIKGQPLGSRQRIWTTNWPAEGATEKYGVSCTDDSGKTWMNFLIGVKAYDFAFKDSIVYVASDQGLYRSPDGGNSWEGSGSIIDRSRGNVISGSVFYATGVVEDTVFGGSGDGLARTIDNATHPFAGSWDVLRTNEPVGTTSKTYAYPNPFSPRQERIRIHYSTGGVAATVTIECFDFGMNRVKTVLRDAQRDGQSEHDELWDGRDESGALLPNGVYFYRVTIAGADPAWGKIMVIQ